MTNLNITAQGERRSERGNVLFLILIAVALFAALSYAVTQSTRSGSGDAGRETNLVNAAGITQYPASIKTAITRMIISNSTSPEELLFDTPSTFTDLNTDALKERGVFYPTGGGANYVEAPPSVMTTGHVGTWHFNSNNQVINIGKSDTSSITAENADIIAFLPYVKKAVCDSIHTKLGLSTDYETIAADVSSDMDKTHDGIDPTNGASIGNASGSQLIGQPQGCFLIGTDEYVYYHVVNER